MLTLLQTMIDGDLLISLSPFCAASVISNI